MQKREASGSILIWSLFFSAFISFMFISISTTINKNIKESYSLWEEIDGILLKEDISNNPLSYQGTLWKNENIEKLESEYSLSNGETSEFRFISTTDVSIKVDVKKWWPLRYVFLVSSWSINPEVTSSWVIYNSQTFSSWMSTSKENGFLYIKDLGGYSQYGIDAPSIIPEKEIYVRTKNYWWYEIQEEFYEVKNFKKWDFPLINYNSFWMEF